MRMPTLERGSIFAKRYRVVRHIGTGGMGAVHEVMHIGTERRLALKVMQPHFLTSDKMLDRFQQEARIKALVDSDFIVEVTDADIDEATGVPFLVMELLIGDELNKLLRNVGRLSEAAVVTLLSQLASALDATHKAGVIHRDLKPDNLFLTKRKDGSPLLKVLDFGIAKIRAAEGTDWNTTLELMGTPAYMAPEQIHSDPGVTAAADIYSFGMIAYTLLVGSAYWKEELDRATNVYAFLTLASKGPIERATARAKRQGVPLRGAFDLWFARATALSPADRFPMASLAILELAKALAVPLPRLPGSTDSRCSIVPASDHHLWAGSPAPAPSSPGRSPPSAPPTRLSAPISAGEPTTRVIIPQERLITPQEPRSPLEQSAPSVVAVITMPLLRAAKSLRIPEVVIKYVLAVTLGVIVFLIVRARLDMHSRVAASSGPDVAPESAAIPDEPAPKPPAPAPTIATPTSNGSGVVEKPKEPPESPAQHSKDEPSNRRPRPSPLPELFEPEPPQKPPPGRRLGIYSSQ